MSLTQQVEQMLQYRQDAADKLRFDEEEKRRPSSRLSEVQNILDASAIANAPRPSRSSGKTNTTSNPRLEALQEIARRSQGLMEDRQQSGLQSRGYSGRKRDRTHHSVGGNRSEDDNDSAVDSTASYSLENTGCGSITLRGAVGLPLSPKPLSESALLVVDAQNTYTEGPLKLFKIDAALANIKALLGRARAAEIPIYHMAHDAGKDTAYDVNGHSGAIHQSVAPLPQEGVVIKKFPNSFHNTTLHQSLQDLEVKNLIIVGFMTHCCVSSTARAAFNLGYESITVVADCTATRVLPDPSRKRDTVTASMQQRASLAAINDLFCNVVESANLIED